MSKFLDLTGKKFGKLLVIKRDKNYIAPCGSIIAQWLCKCDCGNKTVVSTRKLKSGNTKSCGCYHKEKLKKCLQSTGLDIINYILYG